jgi:anti-anti-sigma factor
MRLNLLPAEAGIIRLECAEDLTLLELQSPEEPLDRLLGRECYSRRVLLNLEKAGYIDSAGIGWLVICHKHFLEGGGRLVLHSVSPMVHHAFGVLGLNTVLHVADNEAAALALAAGSTSGEVGLVPAAPAAN